VNVHRLHKPKKLSLGQKTSKKLKRKSRVFFFQKQKKTLEMLFRRALQLSSSSVCADVDITLRRMKHTGFRRTNTLVRRTMNNNANVTQSFSSSSSERGAAAPSDSAANKWLTKLENMLPRKVVASHDYNRWLMVAPAVLTHLSLGSIYAWSLLNEPLARTLGVVADAADDWTLSNVVPVFSIVVFLQGISAAAFGGWQERVGARGSGSLGALFFGGGMMLGGAGVMMHSLPMLYLGYGLLSGLGLGLSYVPVIAELIKWFPDRRGLASGLTIMGFGGGALFAAPAKTNLMNHFQVAPEYLGAESAVNLVVEGGRRYVESASGALREVVVATASDLSKLTFEGLEPGVYAVGTGSTGAGAALGVIGGTYLLVILASSLALRSAPPGYVGPPAVAAAAKQVDGKQVAAETEYVPASVAVRTPEFWKVWVTFSCMSTAGMAFVSVAKTLMGDIFGVALPLVVTAAFATTYVSAVSAANLSGRLLWAATSDAIGCKRMFQIFTLASVPLYLLVPMCVDYVVANPSTMPLIVFYVSTMLTFSMFGGIYSVAPSYQANLFGAAGVGTVHARMMTASAAASVAGPALISTQRSSAYNASIAELIGRCEPDAFEAKFGAPVESAQQLIESKTLTISQLLEILPPDTVDPTPYLYNNTMYTAAALIGIAAIVNSTVKPVDRKHFSPIRYDRHGNLVPPTLPTSPSASMPKLARTVDFETK
jgi:hypothetical protein